MHNNCTMRQLTVPRNLWVNVPADLVTEANARSVPTATVGEMPNSNVSRGVINEPPPTPVSPTRMPTAKPEIT